VSFKLVCTAAETFADLLPSFEGALGEAAIFEGGKRPLFQRGLNTGDSNGIINGLREGLEFILKLGLALTEVEQVFLFASPLCLLFSLSPFLFFSFFSFFLEERKEKNAEMRTSEVLVFYFALLTYQTLGLVQFDNTKPMLDVNGEQVDAHDGMIVQFLPPYGLYYRYAIEYGLYTEVGHLRENGGGCLNHCTTCGGFRFDHNVSVWTSPSLESGTWTLVTREALPFKDRPLATYYRPKVVYNEVTKLYVLWINYAPGGYGNAGRYLSATSSTPEGPFSIAIENIVLDPWVGNHGDLDLFRDIDGSAYVIYTCYCSQSGASMIGGTVDEGGGVGGVSVVLLTPDFLNATATRSSPLANGAGTNAPIFAEAPALFHREGYYYALVTHVCCFCHWWRCISFHCHTPSRSL